MEINAEVLDRAVRTYGERAQTDMAIEEMAELTKAICKLRRADPGAEKKAARNQMLDEVADVAIMLAQLAIMYDPEGTKIQSYINEKTERLNERLERRASTPGPTK